MMVRVFLRHLFRSPRSRFDRRRAGLSLLEVVLAFVILATSMVAIGQLMMLGARRSTTVIEQARGLQYATSVLDAVASGALPLDSAGNVPIETDEEWVYSLDVQAQDTGVSGGAQLLTVVVTVELVDQLSFQNESGGAVNATKPSTVTLTRWIVDPEQVAQRVGESYQYDISVIEALADAEAAAESAEAADGGGR